MVMTVHTDNEHTDREHTDREHTEARPDRSGRAQRGDDDAAQDRRLPVTPSVGIDDQVPNCGTGPAGGARFVAGELVEMWRDRQRRRRRVRGDGAASSSRRWLW